MGQVLKRQGLFDGRGEKTVRLTKEGGDYTYLGSSWSSGLTVPIKSFSTSPATFRRRRGRQARPHRTPRPDDDVEKETDRGS